MDARHTSRTLSRREMGFLSERRRQSSGFPVSRTRVFCPPRTASLSCIPTYQISINWLLFLTLEVVFNLIKNSHQGLHTVLGEEPVVVVMVLAVSTVSHLDLIARLVNDCSTLGRRASYASLLHSRAHRQSTYYLSVFSLI